MMWDAPSASSLVVTRTCGHYPNLDPDQLAPFLMSLRQIYRTQNSYHNFHHALDVLQATHVFLSSAGLVPQASILQHTDDRRWQSNRLKNGAFVDCLSNTDLFALYIAAIGHDVGHPGLTNLFMARPPLRTFLHYADLLNCRKTHRLPSRWFTTISLR